MKKRSWTDDQLREAIRTSFSFRQVMLKLGLKPAGGNYRHLQRYSEEHGLTTTHFKGKAWNKGLLQLGIARIPLEKILVKNSNLPSSQLKRRLINAGLKPERCEQCGWATRGADGYLPLELYYVNGDHTDNRLANLKILCPNCLSLAKHNRSRRK